MLVIIAAYNEEANIVKTVRSLEAANIACDYLIVNDGSSDRTEEVCRENGFSYVSLPVNLGIGGAVQTGYRYALENDYDIAVQIDGDGQHDPAYLQTVLQPILEDKADYVIGSRFVSEKAEGFQSSAGRRVGIRLLSRLIRLCCGVRICDVTSGFRAVSRRSIQEFAEHYPADYPEPEAIIDASLRGERIAEVPVLMRAREHGVSSINLKRSVYYMIKVSLDIIVCRISYGVRRAR